jgi:hypothetical protein
MTLPSTPEVATDCNCSLCRRIGGPWVYFEFGKVMIEGHPEATAEYIWGPRATFLRAMRPSTLILRFVLAAWAGYQAPVHADELDLYLERQRQVYAIPAPVVGVIRSGQLVDTRAGGLSRIRSAIPLIRTALDRATRLVPRGRDSLIAARLAGAARAYWRVQATFQCS